MKLELKENMYIRTKGGIIDKILKLNKSYVKGVSQKDELYAYDIDNIVKASYNIIDLIEVGDFVNGLKVTLINEPSMANCYKRIVYAEDRKGYLIETFTEKDIKSIVTKEAFSSVEYRMETN